MTQSHLPRDPFAAHEVVMERAQQVVERRREERRKPLPEEAPVNVCFVRHNTKDMIQAEVLDVSPSGMRLAAFANQNIGQGDRCMITNEAVDAATGRWATVQWVNQHPLIQVFGVQYEN